MPVGEHDGPHRPVGPLAEGGQHASRRRLVDLRVNDDEAIITDDHRRGGDAETHGGINPVGNLDHFLRELRLPRLEQAFGFGVGDRGPNPKRCHGKTKSHWDSLQHGDPPWNEIAID